ncbi:hypothetical protein V6N13_008159 [Hibiscus sabdariffa]|uniref:Uncharacterized protein n=1 Tax=Hibiscus sabdariffa TaxID=183260 RepID=A0ABR2EE53_9ROSI
MQIRRAEGQKARSQLGRLDGGRQDRVHMEEWASNLSQKLTESNELCPGSFAGSQDLTEEDGGGVHWRSNSAYGGDKPSQ